MVKKTTKKCISSKLFRSEIHSSRYNLKKLKPLILTLSQLFSISFTGMLFYWHWEAKLISQLATRVTVLPFNSIEQLVRTSEYRLYVAPGTANEDDFKYSTDPVMQEAWTKKIEPYLEEYKVIKGYKKVIELVRNDPTVTMYLNFYGIRYDFGIISKWHIQYYECCLS
jgi:hypothetical protein